MPYIEIAWIEGGRHPYIDPDIETVVGYTADEVRAMDNSIISLVTSPHIPTLYALLEGPPSGIKSRTLPLRVRHKRGHEICCHATLICRYNSDGQLAEAWGAVRLLPSACAFNELEEWWIKAPQLIRQIVHDSSLLFPASA
jgi:hypothetical protein